MPDDRVKLANETSDADDQNTGTPALAAIVVVPDTYDTVRRTVRHLQAQTVAERIEVIIVTPSREQLKLDEADFKCFHSWNIIEIGILTSIADAFTAGIRHAHAPVHLVTAALVLEHAQAGRARFVAGQVRIALPEAVAAGAQRHRIGAHIAAVENLAAHVVETAE